MRFVFFIAAAGLLTGQPASRSFGQLAPQHGLQVASAAAYLAKPPEIKAPDGTGDFRVNSIRQDLLEQARTLADCNGALSGAANLADDAATALLLKQRPCALFETWAEQRFSDYAESAQSGFTGIERTEGKTVLRRFVRDGIRQIYIGYSATVETMPDGTYRVSFGASPDPAPADVRSGAGWKAVTPAKLPVPQIVTDEDAVRLDLYASGGSRKMVDYVHVGRQDRMVLRKDGPHDSYAEDAELSLSQPRVRVNGVPNEAVAALPETIRGPVLWIYVPGHGRFVLSLHSHAELGFESAGEATGNSLTFNAPDGSVFRIVSAERVAAGSGSYTVHVLLDTNWEPADALDRTRIMMGAAPGV